MAYDFNTPDQNAMLNSAFNASTGHYHDGTSSRYVPYHVLAAGKQAITSTTTTVGVFDVIVALASIEAADVVLAQVIASTTASVYVTRSAITAGVGFSAYTNAATIGSISYVVFKST